MQIVAYLRVSTARQGASGLGLDAQRSAVMAYAAAGGHSVVAELVEVESGKKADRPQLAAALAVCKLRRATLVIAKLDRLSRNVAFIANLMEGGVEFVACDMPHANRLTLHLMAAMAEHKREMISARTKAALAAKARGVRLGNPNGAAHLLPGCQQAGRASATARQVRAREHDRAVADAVQTLRAGDTTGARAIAADLNAYGIPAPSGGVWYAGQVGRLIGRLEEKSGVGTMPLSQAPAIVACV